MQMLATLAAVNSIFVHELSVIAFTIIGSSPTHERSVLKKWALKKPTSNLLIGITGSA